MNTIVSSGLALLLVLTGAAAQAEVYSEGDQWLLAKYDLNGDAQISQQEVMDKKQRLFAMLDADADGEISFAEYEEMDMAKRKALLRSRFNKLDGNHDGKVSDAEYGSFMGMFSSIDSNRDGVLSSKEMGMGHQPEAQVTRCLLWLCVRNHL